MTNKFALSSNYFKEPSVAKWESALFAGITDVELGLLHDCDTESILVKAQKDYNLLVTCGMNVSSVHLPFGKDWDISMKDNFKHEDALQKLRELIDWMSDKEIGIAVLHASAEPISDDERARRLLYAIETIEILGDYSKARGVSLAVENLPRTCLGNSVREMLTLTNNGKSAKICFDVNHLFIDSHSEFIRMAGSHIITTHFSDYDLIDERHWLPGEGCIDWAELIEALRKDGYEGRFLFEINEFSTPSLKRAITPNELVERFMKVSELNKMIFKD